MRSYPSLFTTRAVMHEQFDQNIAIMKAATSNAVRSGEPTWLLCEPEVRQTDLSE